MRAMPTLRQLQYYVAIAEELSFVRAAARLHLSQPPLSAQIKALEEELGVTLLDRDTRSVKLTEAGRVFLTGAQRILSEIQLVSQQAVRTATGEIGTLRIGCVASSMANVLPRILARLHAVLPDVQVSLHQLNSIRIVEALRHGEIDLALFHAPNDVDDIETRPCFREPFCAILPPGHPLADADPLRLAMLANEDFVNFARASAPAVFDTMVGACVKAGFSPNIAHSGDFAAMIQMAELGLGVALVPLSLAQRMADRVVVRHLDEEGLELNIDIGWKRDGAVPLVKRAFAAILAEDGV